MSTEQNLNDVCLIAVMILEEKELKLLILSRINLKMMIILDRLTRMGRYNYRFTYYWPVFWVVER